MPAMSPWFDGEETDLTMIDARQWCLDRGTDLMLPTLGQTTHPDD